MGAVRSVIVWLMVIAASGAAPVATVCLESGSDCGESCTRCWCKRRLANHAVRPVCPCCQPQDVTPVTLIPPAVLPAPVRSICPSPDAIVAAPATPDAGPYVCPVPDPPPKSSLPV